ncbi:MAG: indolepyruvate ferredoxin oxidoreductase subunit alpha [Actinobacteria bacterium]|nr:indolepyruvate ferredoxin oxidoreductase subunit alpha [Actinomycetota bacterium]
MMKLLSGNEAIARGAYESGVVVATAYPGTPSTEILENIKNYKEIYCQWSPNEKVALEVAIGASFAGARTLVAMKHVGVNVAADPFMTLSYTGIKGGLVLVSADDPAMHSSQNEQDNRHYAEMAKIPMLEPSDSQEAKDFISKALEISERFDTPVLLRITTRIAHSEGRVKLSKRIKNHKEFRFEKNPQKFVMIPAFARRRHAFVEDRLKKIKKYSEDSELNKMELASKDIGIITSGISYQYAKEVIPDASFLKLGMSYPLCKVKTHDFTRKVKKIFVIEEGDRFLENSIRAIGVDLEAKSDELLLGELNIEKVESILHKKKYIKPKEIGRVNPPKMCPGCPHRGIFYILNRLKFTVTGDIGCYTLAVLPPLNSIDTCICMGASIGNAIGLSKVIPEEDNKKVVAVIGDSTFIHSGITGLIDAVYNNSNITVIILDNETTAMTGGQDHPGTGITLRGNKTKALDFKKLCKAIGVSGVEIVDPYNLDEVKAAILRAKSINGVSVIISKRKCILIDKKAIKAPVKIDEEKCKICGMCIKLGCPAIIPVSEDEMGRMEKEKNIKKDKEKEKKKEKNKNKSKDMPPVIDENLCTGCGLCEQVCKFDAIIPT